MVGFAGQFGKTVLGGMVTVLKVRERTDGYKDPGPFQFPDGTVMAIARPEDLERDRIELANAGSRKQYRPGQWQPS